MVLLTLTIVHRNNNCTLGNNNKTSQCAIIYKTATHVCGRRQGEHLNIDIQNIFTDLVNIV